MLRFEESQEIACVNISVDLDNQLQPHDISCGNSRVGIRDRVWIYSMAAKLQGGLPALKWHKIDTKSTEIY